MRAAGIVEQRKPAGLRESWSFSASDFARLRAVRRDTLDILRRFGEPASDFESCAVVVSELMSNAALHGPGGEIRVTLDWSATTPSFAVSDAGRGFVPAIGLPPPNREGGRGLYLVKTLAATPHVSVDDGGCTVSVRLPVKRRRSSSVP